VSRRPRRSPVVGLALGVALGLGVLATPAAAAPPQIEAKPLGKAVTAAVTAAYPDLPVTRVRCPRTVKATVGRTARCTVRAGAYDLQMQVTVVDRRGNVGIASTQAVIPKAAVETFVRENATLPVTVDCGPEPYVVRLPNETFACTARFEDGTSQQATLTVVDAAGNVTITSVANAP
jgi:hypothetical protein